VRRNCNTPFGIKWVLLVTDNMSTCVGSDEVSADKRASFVRLGKRASFVRLGKRASFVRLGKRYSHDSAEVEDEQPVSDTDTADTTAFRCDYANFVEYKGLGVQ
jgi:hypothetical protein